LNWRYHPPMGPLLAGAVPALAGAKVPRADPSSRPRTWMEVGDQYALATAAMTGGGLKPIDLWLSRGRAAFLVFTHLIPVLVFLTGRAAGGPAAGAIAFGAAVLCPALTAHGSLVTTDAAITLFFFAAFAALWAWDRSRAPGWAAAAGAAFGLALCSKQTAIVFLPVPFAWIAARERTRPGLRAGAYLGLSLGAAATLVYRGGELPLLFGLLRDTFHDLQAGQRSFLLGRITEKGVWTYFPVAFLVKTPAAVLVGIPIALFFFWRRVARAPVLLWAPGAAYFLSACASPFQIGHRHILPVYPFLYLMLGLGLAPLWNDRRGRWAVGALAAWMTAAAVRAAPFPLAYFNEFVGGPARGYKILTDSNVDWGQGLKALQAYMKKEGVGDFYFSYFGSVDPSVYGLRCLDVDSVGPVPPTECGADPRREKKALLAVSVTNYQGTYYKDPRFFLSLHRLKPVALVADSILVFDVTNEPAAHRWLSALFRDTGRPAASEREARWAEDLEKGARP
jgi:hypothetical protein